MIMVRSLRVQNYKERRHITVLEIFLLLFVLPLLLELIKTGIPVLPELILAIIKLLEYLKKKK